MIKNEKQFKVSKKKLAELEHLTVLKKSKTKPKSKEEGALNSLFQIIISLKEEIRQYENLKKRGIPLRRKVTVAQLPSILIEHKIALKFASSLSKSKSHH